MSTPKIAAFLTADRVTESGGKFSLSGVYNVIRKKTFPATHTLECYLAVTNGRKENAFTLRVVDGDFSTVAERDVTIRFTGPIETQEVRVAMSVKLPRRGEYYLQVVRHDEVLFERRITVQQLATAKEAS